MKGLVLQFQIGQITVQVNTQGLLAVQWQGQTIGLPHEFGGLTLTPLLQDEVVDGSFTLGLDDQLSCLGFFAQSLVSCHVRLVILAQSLLPGLQCLEIIISLDVDELLSLLQVNHGRLKS